MASLLREYSGSLFLSVLLHGLVAAAFILAAVLHFSTDTPVAANPAPIEAVVVNSQVLQAADAAKAAAREEAEARAAAQARAAADLVAAQAKAEADAKAAADAKADADAKAQADARAAAQAKAAADARAADAKAAATFRAAELAKTQAAAEAASKAAAQAAEKQRAESQAQAQARAAEAKRAAEEKSAADAKAAADAKRAAEQRARAEREAELRRQIADEEHASAVEAGPLADSYRLSLENRIIHAWLRPPSARLGIDCRVEVTQVPGGEVVGARVTQCNGDAAVRQSIENAVYRASPLPQPPDPALFHRVFVFEFKPTGE